MVTHTHFKTTLTFPTTAYAAMVDGVYLARLLNNHHVTPDTDEERARWTPVIQTLRQELPPGQAGLTFHAINDSTLAVKDARGAVTPRVAGHILQALLCVHAPDRRFGFTYASGDGGGRFSGGAVVVDADAVLIRDAGDLLDGLHAQRWQPAPVWTAPDDASIARRLQEWLVIERGPIPARGLNASWRIVKDRAEVALVTNALGGVAVTVFSNGHSLTDGWQARFLADLNTALAADTHDRRAALDALLTAIAR